MKQPEVGNDIVALRKSSLQVVKCMIMALYDKDLRSTSLPITVKELMLRHSRMRVSMQ